MTLGLVKKGTLKNTNFILETKVTKLDQSKNLKQPDRPDVVWKLYSILWINEHCI